MNKFKKNQKVVCINNNGLPVGFIPLELKKVYTVEDDNGIIDDSIELKEIGIVYSYLSRRFISLKEYHSIKYNNKVQKLLDDKN